MEEEASNLNISSFSKLSESESKILEPAAAQLIQPESKESGRISISDFSHFFELRARKCRCLLLLVVPALPFLGVSRLTLVLEAWTALPLSLQAHAPAKTIFIAICGGILLISYLASLLS